MSADKNTPRTINRRSNSRLLPRPWIRTSKNAIHIRWGAFSCYLLVTLICLWMGITGGIFLFIKYNAGYVDVSYKHILGLPLTINAYRHAKGEYNIKEGLIAVQQARWRDAFDLLRIGLAARADHEEARLTLARLYLMARRPDLAKSVFLEGLNHNTNQAQYVRTVLTFLFSQQADETVIEIADNLLSSRNISDELRKTLLVARLYSYFNRDQFGEARASIRGTVVEQGPQAKFIEARIAWESGSRESSLIALKSLYTQHPQEEDIYKTLQLYLQSKGSLDEARRLAISRQLQFPNKVEPYLDFISLCALDKNDTRRTEAIEEFLHIFHSDTPALLRLQAFAAQYGWSELAWRIVNKVGPENQRQRVAAVAFALESEITSRDFATAAIHITEWLGKDQKLTESEQISFISLQALTFYGLGVETEGANNLNRVISSNVTATSTLLALSKHLLAQHKQDMAKRILARVLELDPLNQTALVSLLQLKLETRTLDESLELIELLPSIRKPPRDLMHKILEELNSDSYLYLSNIKKPIESLKTRLNYSAQRAEGSS